MNKNESKQTHCHRSQRWRAQSVAFEGETGRWKERTLAQIIYLTDDCLMCSNCFRRCRPGCGYVYVCVENSAWAICANKSPVELETIRKVDDTTLKSHDALITVSALLFDFDELGEIDECFRLHMTNDLHQNPEWKNWFPLRVSDFEAGSGWTRLNALI